MASFLRAERASHNNSSQREIFSQSCYCGCAGPEIANTQSKHTLPKRNSLFSQSCYCGLLVWSFLSGPAHPPKEKYSLFAVRVACSVYLHFRTSTPSQSEIFSLTAVIVTCSLCSYTVAFQDQHTSQREIFSQSCYCGLLCVFAFQDQHTLPKRNIL